MLLPRWFALSVCGWAGLAAAEPADLDALLSGVSKVVAPGCIPAPVVPFGDQAFCVFPAKAGGRRAAMFAATRFGEGRVFAEGHGGFWSTENLAQADNLRMLLNAVAWLAAGRDRPRIGLRDFQHLELPLQEAGYAVRRLDGAALVPALAELDVIFLGAFQFSDPTPPPAIADVRLFVERGGGLFIGGCSWGWQQLNPTRDLRTDMGGNRLLEPLGLVWCDAYLGTTTEGGYAVDREELAALHAGHALTGLERHGHGEIALSPAVLAQMGETVTLAIRSLPPTDALLLPRARRLLTDQGPVAPSEKEPVKADQPLARLAVVLDHEFARNLAPEEVTAHPAAAAFPGPVPADAPRVSRELTVDTHVPGWHSTGLYASPGEVITVTVPAAAAGQGLAVRIGCHTDELWSLESWKRFPAIAMRRPLAAAQTRLASRFGGPLYIDVPGDCQLDEITVTVDGAVEAPFFVAGRTSLREWRERIRHRPAPWAELAGDKVILSVPSTVVRDLEDPERLMAFWDQVLDANADLAQRPRERNRPERYCTDVQISAGYMHSGYPIMTHLDAAPRFVDWAGLTTKGDWGMFHEMGHNHQSGHWTFGGTGEVTVNLFTLFVLECVCHIPVAGGRAYEESLNKKVAEYFANGARFADWQRDPFLALRMYVQLQQAFGWGAFQRVFAAYRDTAPESLPKSDEEKRDQWLVRFSREVGYNLGPFFEAWGVPTSEAARASLAELPVWMPENLAEF